MKFKKYFMLLTVLILLFTLSAVNANDLSSDCNNTESVNVNSNMIDESAVNNIKSIEKITTASEDNPSEVSSDSKIDDELEDKTLNKNKSMQVKSAKQSMTLSISNYTCNVDDIVHVTTIMNPGGVTDGVLMYSLDDDLLGTCNIANVGTGFDVDTYGYEVGVHTLTVEFTASLSYESTSVSSTLIITQPVTVTSTDTSLVSGIYSPFPVGVSVYSSDEDACGDVELYINDSLVKTYSSVFWNNLNVSVPEVNIVDNKIVLPMCCNKAGNYTWSLEFKNNCGYSTDSVICGSLELLDSLEVFLTDESISCYPGDEVVVNYTLKPVNAIGGLIVYTEDYIYGRAIYLDNHSFIIPVELDPCTSSLYVSYNPGIATSDYYDLFNLDVDIRRNLYPSADSNSIPVNVLKVPVTLESFNVSYNDDNDLFFNVELSSRDKKFEDYYIGEFNVYCDDELLTSLDLYDYDSNIVENHNILNFTLNKIYNHRNLRFEYSDSYYDDLSFERYVDLDEKSVTLTSDSIINAHVGDLVEIAYSFNDSLVNDGLVSISYGASQDNITDVTSSNGIICFDSADYMQGEYNLILTYYDSNVYQDTSIPITLKLYQPTNITADQEELNITVGEGNTYTVNFECSRDSWNDVIWGSIDVYIDDRIIDTLIIDDDTENCASIILDDYNLENITPGEHTLKAVFTSDDPYIESSEIVIPMNITGEVTIEFPEKITLMINESANIKAIVKFNNQTITTGTIHFEIINITSSDILLNTNSFIPIIAKMEPGSYLIKLYYHDPDGMYPDANITSNIIVRTNQT